MSPALEDVVALGELEAKLRAILPELYRNSYEDVLPVSMGSASLKYDAEGRVAWDKIWATFCDLAMAGGPPHRGTLLESASTEAISVVPQAYARVAEEICRGVSMITGLTAQPASAPGLPGWIGIQCRSIGMAGWLMRAIVMENVVARQDTDVLYLPAGPDFRMEKEIKNVIVSIAKTCHYWTEHMSQEQQESIDAMFAHAPIESGLPQPEAYRRVLDAIARDIGERTGQTCFLNRYLGWIGIECADVRMAVWLMRAMVAENVLARREGCVLFLSVSSPERLVDTYAQAHRLHALKKYDS